MAAGQVTSGNELNAYQGNPNLASVGGSGYAKLDLSPLATYAAYAYNTHLEDYKQQQKDKTKLEDLYNDPETYLQLDKNYADQIKPTTDKLKSLGMQNLQMQPNSDKWYEFMDTHKQLVSDNARLKAVQDRKNSYKKLSEESADVHEKERLDAYVDQLDKYKLGEDVPVYNKYFKADESHIPTGIKSTGTKQEVLPNGNVVTKKFTIFNPIGLNKETAQNLALHPEYGQTYSDIAHKYLEQGDLSIINDANADTYDKSMLLNMSELRTKYKSDFAKYQKQFPGKTFGDFMTFNGKDDELQQIYQGNAFLKQSVQQIPATVDGGKELAGYTYYTDPKTGAKTRLNVPDSDLAAMMGATKNVPGEKDEVVSEIVGVTPKDKFEAAKQLQIERENNAQRERDSLRDDATKRYIAELKDYADGTSKNKPELPVTPLPSIFASIGEYNKRVKVSDLPVSQIAAINPNWLDSKGQLKEKNALGRATKFGDIEISIGKRADGTDGVFIFTPDNKGGTKQVLNESTLKSNAESWLAAFAKERKGQDVYGYIDDLYKAAQAKNALGNDITPTPAKTEKIAPKPVMKNKSDYYNVEENVTKTEGNIITYKDGTVWEFKDGKLNQIK